jgi:hypothetical protein
MPAKRKEYDITKNPAYITGMKMMEQEKVLKNKADAQAKVATENSKVKYEGYLTDMKYPAIRPVPQVQGSSSPSRSQLLKARGTQSSAIRTLIK